MIKSILIDLMNNSVSSRILKFLLKGSFADSSHEVSQVLANSSITSSNDNIVEIKPIEEVKTVSEFNSV